MSQRDCGCPGLVTPTLDELLAVARQKPLPRVRIRERRPPPVKVGAALKGWMEWRLVNRQGREVRGGEGPNLILDQGLNQIAETELKYQGSVTPPAGYFPIIGYAAVGTDSSSPTVSDTGLGAELARTNSTFAGDAITRPSPGVYRLTRSIEFDYGEANGNLTEWGFSNTASAGANLFNRALFTDSGGDPDTVTKTDQEKLRLTYTLEVALTPVSMTPGSFTIAGVGTVNGDYTLIGANAPSSASDIRNAPDLHLFSSLARGVITGVTGSSQWPGIASIRVSDSDLSGVSYTDAISNTFDSSSNPQTIARDATTFPRDAYTSGSFTRAGGAWRWDTTYGNLDPIRGFLLGGMPNFSSQPPAYVAYAFALDPGDVFSKDDEHTLTVGVPTVTWGRAS